MKKYLVAFGFASLMMSCVKEKEETSTELENLKRDVADLKEKVRKLEKEPIDTIAKDIKNQVKAKDGFEGQKSQY
jgi:hypothetical protein